MIALNWKRPKTGSWHRLDSIDTMRIKDIGIFLIWHDGDPGHVIRVSQGDIGRQLQLEQISPQVLKHRIHGELFVTWASVPAALRDGIERYLANMYEPRVGNSYPLTTPLAATAPW